MQSELLPAEPWVLPLTGGLNVTAAVDDAWLIDRVCAPRDSVREELTARGFVFRDKPQRVVLRGVLGHVARLLTNAPRLEIAVRAAVSEVVLLRAHPAVDISHSEPRWPRTIFISVPGRRSEVSALRATENVVHEAMHLQLTVFEQARPLIADKTMQMASPWREEPRHLRGVLHGLYVFRCISAFFATPSLRDVLDTEGAGHAARRCAQIDEEISRLDIDGLARGMTTEGRIFLGTLR